MKLCIALLTEKNLRQKELTKTFRDCKRGAKKYENHSQSNVCYVNTHNMDENYVDKNFNEK